jgi:hypothetical protein
MKKKARQVGSSIFVTFLYQIFHFACNLTIFRLISRENVTICAWSAQNIAQKSAAPSSLEDGAVHGNL